MVAAGDQTHEVEYTPNCHIGFGWGIWRQMFRELTRSRELIWRLFLRDLSGRYRQSIFGYFWAVLPAIVMVVTFTYLNHRKILPEHFSQTDLPYPAYVLLGMTVWQLFSTGLVRTTHSLANARAIILKINFSRESLVIAAFGESVFNFLIRLVLVALVFIWLRDDIKLCWTVVCVPLVLIGLCFLSIGFGFFLSIANAVFRDIGNGLALVLTFAMFLSPVVYPAPTEGPLVLINYLNPVSPYIIAVQDLVSKGHLSQPVPLIGAYIFSVVIFLLGWRLFHLAISRIAERL
ncbi:MAG: ABC transporter permease [Planctomycetes bacterium]|nr:ABC transporter permease [Planctomycetota bacterium]